MALPEPLDLLACADPVHGFRAAQAEGRLIALRSSGTTDSPRVVVRTTASWADSFDAVSELCAMSADARTWIPGPVSASMNAFARVHADAVGAEVVDDPGVATHAVLTPLLLARALDHGLLAPGVSAVVAGDAMPAGLVRRALEAGLDLHHYYGASELSFVAWASGDRPLRPFPGVECRVVDGVIWARSPYLSEGYGPLNDATRPAPGPYRRDEDGFGTVLDRGELVDGRLLVHGRGEAWVTTAGVTVDLAEVERVLRTDANGAVVVVGIPDDRLGAIVVAVLDDSDDLPRARAHASSVLQPSHRPRRWYVLPDLPLTLAGKPDRQALAEQVLAGGLAPVGR